ncbi:MAG: lysine--tRNA ligase [Patescibacteria group bacterium]|nr:lysine--tRNA ligase [Patescibacteria group bacterium]
MPSSFTLKEERIKKLKQFEAEGINPYPSICFEKEDSQAVLKKEIGESAKVAGRIILFRDMGKIAFLNLKDARGKIQLVLNTQEFEGDYKLWIKNLDLGDFIGAEGERFDTRKGEKSILVKKLTLLSKSVRPLSDKYKGIADDDARQRFRELEMIANEETMAKFKRRSKMIQTIREFMWQQSFMEVETPVLQTVYGGTYAKPFTTHYNALDFDLYLRIAPEMFLKRLMVGGFEKVFEIGKCFRNEGMGPAHLQEFTMFEFYWAYADYAKLMEFTEQMIAEIIEKTHQNFKVSLGGKTIDLKPPYPREKFADLFKKYLKVSLEELDTPQKIDQFVKERGLEEKVDFSKKMGWASKLDELFKKTIRKEIIQPVFVVDYPKEFMALAKANPDDSETVMAMQLVVNGWELLKAYNELNDPAEQRQRFEQQQRLAKEGDEGTMPYDHDFVKSMEYGMPPVAGWGMGLDRFFALLEGEDNLRDTILFPTMKPKNKIKSK